MSTHRNHETASAVAEPALAGSFLEGLAGQDFAGLGGALAAGARRRALLPPGVREWAGSRRSFSVPAGAPMSHPAKP